MSFIELLFTLLIKYKKMGGGGGGVCDICFACNSHI